MFDASLTISILVSYIVVTLCVHLLSVTVRENSHVVFYIMTISTIKKIPNRIFKDHLKINTFLATRNYNSMITKITDVTANMCSFLHYKNIRFRNKFMTLHLINPKRKRIINFSKPNCNFQKANTRFDYCFLHLLINPKEI